MTHELNIALIAGGFAILGSLVTGWFTYASSASQKDLQRYKRRLVQAYQDIAAFHRLEERYTSALSTTEKSADVWKREIRKALRDDNYSSPSEDATVTKAEGRLKDLI
jgi:hypothetical protein